MPALARPIAALALTALVAAAACGGNVVVDTGSASGTGAFATATNGTGAFGASGTGADTTGAGASTGTGTTTLTADSPQCEGDFNNVVSIESVAQGCTPTNNVPQCTGSALVHDPCGCLVLANEAHSENLQAASQIWMECLADGCCGPSAVSGCTTCPPAPTSGFCDPSTSHCMAGP